MNEWKHLPCHHQCQWLVPSREFLERATADSLPGQKWALTWGPQPWHGYKIAVWFSSGPWSRQTSLALLLRSCGKKNTHQNWSSVWAAVLPHSCYSSWWSYDVTGKVTCGCWSCGQQKVLNRINWVLLLLIEKLFQNPTLQEYLLPSIIVSVPPSASSSNMTSLVNRDKPKFHTTKECNDVTWWNVRAHHEDKNILQHTSVSNQCFDT